MDRPELAKKLLDTFLAAKKEIPEGYSVEHTYRHGEDFNPVVRDTLRTAYEASKPARGFEDLLMKLSEAWDGDVIAELDQYTSEDFERVFLSYDGDELRKRIIGVSDIRRVSSSNESQPSVIRKFREALLRIAKTSPINAERVARTWGVQEEELPQQPVATMLDIGEANRRKPRRDPAASPQPEAPADEETAAGADEGH